MPNIHLPHCGNDVKVRIISCIPRTRSSELAGPTQALWPPPRSSPHPTLVRARKNGLSEVIEPFLQGQGLHRQVKELPYCRPLKGHQSRPESDQEQALGPAQQAFRSPEGAVSLAEAGVGEQQCEIELGRGPHIESFDTCLCSFSAQPLQTVCNFLL